MALKIISAGSVSANYHVHVRSGGKLTDQPDVAQGNTSVSAGLANEKTLVIPIKVYDCRVYIQGAFGSGSASTAVAIDMGISAAGPFFNLFSVSGNFASTIPIHGDEIIRFRHTYSSAAVAGALGASVDCWIA